jgi:hypothetical protein
MAKKPINRREFLKTVLAGAAAAGLGHFRILNFGGAVPALADACGVGVPDYCNPGEDDDLCPDPNQATSSDVCVPEQGEMDECIPTSEPDVCDAVTEPLPDICAPDIGDPDECEVPPGGPDTCMTAPDDPDICPDGGPPVGDGDICNETGPQANPDECIPAVNESDGCTASAEPDFCRDPETGQVAHDLCTPPQDEDICYENGQNTIDICDPGNNDPDADPNVVRLASLQARPGTTTVGLVAALGAAALFLRSGEPASPEKDNTAA